MSRTDADGRIADVAGALLPGVYTRTFATAEYFVEQSVECFFPEVIDGAPHNHTWTRTGPEVRTVAVTVDGSGPDRREWVIGGVNDLVVLKSAGSEFEGFLTDPYTVLEPTRDRVMATSLVAQWRFVDVDVDVDVDWDETYRVIRATMLERSANLQSKALQQTLFEMGRAVLERFPFIAEVRLSAPDKHHFVYDLARFGLANDNEVFHADDRPYGLIQATVEREDAPDAGHSWDRCLDWIGRLPPVVAQVDPTRKQVWDRPFCVGSPHAPAGRIDRNRP